MNEDFDVAPRPRPRPRPITRPAPIFTLFSDWLNAPVPLMRLEIIRILAPIAVLGFMSGRLAHADEWIGDAGFRVPNLGQAEWRQPFYISALPGWAAWGVAVAMVASGLATSAGYRTRIAAAVFSASLAFVALSDRLAAFTVSKLSPVVMLVLALSASGSRASIDSWLRRRRDPDFVTPTRTTGGVRFFQVFLPVMYCGSGIAKARGDWLSDHYVLWSHLHDSYQTPFSFWLAALLPGFMWTLFQYLTLAFETFAPIWFISARTRTVALCVGLGMHAMIGLMFGPVKWFAMLMMSLLLGAYLPDSIIARVETFADRFERPAKDLAPSPKSKKKKKRKKLESNL